MLSRLGIYSHGRLQKYNSRVWLEPITQVMDVLFPEFMEREEEIVSVIKSETGRESEA